MKLTDTKAVGEWSMFKRLIFAGIACMVMSLASLVWALVANERLVIMLVFMWLFAAWTIITVAAESGSYSTNPRVRDWAKKVKGT